MNAVAAAKVVGIVLLTILLMHWLTAGQDEIIEGPPEIPDGQIMPSEPSPGPSPNP